MIWILVIILHFQQFVDCKISPSFTRLKLPPNVRVPEAIAFDARGGGPYTGVVDGRILKYEGPKLGFVDYATTSPFRTKQQCDGANATTSSTCGRPVGLAFNYFTGEMYVADVVFGFVVVPPGGGLAKQLATGFNGTTFEVPNAVDIDQMAQVVYFTDSGKIFLVGNTTKIVQSRDKSGKLYSYNIRTKKIKLLLSGLYGPAGVAVSKTGAYLLINEFIALRIRKFWLKGSRAGCSQILINVQGTPDNIKRTISGDFWVAHNIVNQQPFQTTSIIGLKISGHGFVKASLNLTAEYGTDLISEVQEHSGKLYIGSISANFVGVYRI